MPESRSRRKANTAESNQPAISGDDQAENPIWYKAVMFGFMIFGLIWILTFYISSAQWPLGSASPINLANWNILIGFGIAMIGFVMTTKWK